MAEAPGRYRSLYRTAAVPYTHLQTALGRSLGYLIDSDVARVYSRGNHIAEFLRQRHIAAPVGMR